MADSSIRREFLAVHAATLIPARAAPVESHQATGVKAGEITPNPAIL